MKKVKCIKACRDQLGWMDGWMVAHILSTPTNISAMEIRQTRAHFSDLFLTWFGESELNVAWASCCSLTSRGGGGRRLTWCGPSAGTVLSAGTVSSELTGNFGHFSVNCGNGCLWKSQPIPFLEIKPLLLIQIFNQISDVGPLLFFLTL